MAAAVAETEAFTPKTILITGAGSGLGAGSALGLAAAGHNVIACCYIQTQVSDLKSKAKELGVELETPRLDITNAEQRDYVFKKYGDSVDIIVCNAAIGEGGPVAELPTDRVRNNFEVNVFSQLDFIGPYIKTFAAKGSGKVVFISSIAGAMAFPILGCYCATKHAIEAFAQALRQELAPTGVKVCTINPAPYNTGFNDRNLETADEWFDDNVNWSGSKPIKDMQMGMAGMQYDPKLMVDFMVETIPKETHLFRNVWTPDWEVATKSYTAQLYAMDMDGNVPDDYWGKTEDGLPMPIEKDTSKHPIMSPDDLRPMGL